MKPEKDTSRITELLSKATADSPHFERVGTSDDGNGLYEMNSLDLLIYMAGLKSMKEASDGE